MKMTEPEPKKSSLLPAMGFIIALGVGAIAFFLAPELIKFLGGLEIQGMSRARFYSKLGIGAGTTDDIMGTSTHIAFAVLIWFAIFSILMLIVASALGTNVADQDAALLRPKESDRKGMKAYHKKLDKHQRKQAKLAKDYVKRKEKGAKKK